MKIEISDHALVPKMSQTRLKTIINFYQSSRRLLHYSLPKWNFYATLGVPRDADQKTIKKAFRKKSLECHPDKFPGDEVKEKRFKEISEAYQTLSDKKLKSDYDLKGSPSSGSGPGGGPAARAGSARGAGASQSGYDASGRYHYRDPRDRFQYQEDSGYSDAYGRRYGSPYGRDRGSFKTHEDYQREEAERNSQQRTEQWSRVYEELNRQRHEQFQDAKANKKADFSDFGYGSGKRMDGRYYTDYREYYDNPDDFRFGGKRQHFASTFREKDLYGTDARFNMDQLKSAALHMKYDMNSRGLFWIDYLVRGLVFGIMFYVFYFGFSMALDLMGRDQYNEQVRQNSLLVGSRKHDRTFYNNQGVPIEYFPPNEGSAADNIYNERARLYRERLKQKQDELERAIAAKNQEIEKSSQAKPDR